MSMPPTTKVTALRAVLTLILRAPLTSRSLVLAAWAELDTAIRTASIIPAVRTVRSTCPVDFMNRFIRSLGPKYGVSGYTKSPDPRSIYPGATFERGGEHQARDAETQFKTIVGNIAGRILQGRWSILQLVRTAKRSTVRPAWSLRGQSSVAFGSVVL